MGRHLLQGLIFSGILAIANAGHASDETASAPEFEAESAALIAATIDFFDRVEARQKPRTRLPVIGIPLSATKIKAEVVEDGMALMANGPVDHLTGYRITWYPTERLLGSVDFMGTWNGNRNLVCGYLTWDLSDPASPRLHAVDARFVDLAELGGQSPEDIHGRLLEANCAYGAIDENFHLFDVAG